MTASTPSAAEPPWQPGPPEPVGSTAPSALPTARSPSSQPGQRRPVSPPASATAASAGATTASASASASASTPSEPPSQSPPQRPAPRLSVVVPTYLRPPLLLRCLGALARQTLPADAFELIVVDDGHDEATRLAVERLAREQPQLALRYLRPASGRGPAVARNCGWRAARAPLVAFTDDDTLPDADWLREGEQAMQQPAPDGTRWAALCGRVVVPRPDGVAADAPPTDHERMTQGLASAEFVTANAFVRRDALRRVSGFDERFKRAWREDSDLQFRLQRDAGPVGRCETATVVHPVRAEPWGISLRQQKNVFFDALLYREHPRLYRQRILASPPWDYFAIVGLVVAALPLALTGAFARAAACLAVAALLVLRFAARRLRGTSREPAHVAEMLATSALIPFLSVYWRLRGAWHFRVWYL